MAFLFRNRTVKELRKKWCLTTRELAMRVKVDNIDILKIDEFKIKDVPEPLRTKLLPVLRGDDLDKMPWL
ncbi:MAG: transcriptional regulator [Bacillota bacterium]